MFKSIQKKSAQSMLEYSLAIVLVTMVVVAMTIFMRRALQARISDAKTYMIQTAQSSSGTQILNEYEPYYSETCATVIRTMDENAQLLSHDPTQPDDPSIKGIPVPSGYFSKDFNETTATNSYSVQLPPAGE